MENKGVIFSENEIGSSFTIEIKGGGYEYLNTVRPLLRLLGEAEEGLIDCNERSNICNLIECMLPSDEQINLISWYSPHAIDDLESNNKILEQENEYLKTMLESKEGRLDDKEKFIQMLLKKLNHGDQEIQADHDSTN